MCSIFELLKYSNCVGTVSMSEKRNRIRCLLGGVVLMAASSTQAMIVQNFSVDDVVPAAAPTVNNVVLNQSHNPALGTADWAALQSVTISVTATVTANVRVENTDTFNLTPITFTFEYTPTVNVDINGGANIFTGINPEATGSAGPLFYDGNVDFGGTGGSTQTLSGMDSDSTGLAIGPFDGNGTIQLDFTTLIQDLNTTPFVVASPTGKPFVDSSTYDVDITGTLTYTFAPEPGTLILMVSVFGIAGFLRRRRLNV